MSDQYYKVIQAESLKKLKNKLNRLSSRWLKDGNITTIQKGEKRVYSQGIVQYKNKK